MHLETLVPNIIPQWFHVASAHVSQIGFSLQLIEEVGTLFFSRRERLVVNFGVFSKLELWHALKVSSKVVLTVI